MEIPARPAGKRLGKGFTMASLFLALALGGCGQGEEQAAPQPPPPEVGVITLKPQPVTRVVELPGRVQAVRTAEVRARVDGIVERRLYREGSDVRAGDPLFAIDPRPLRASLSAAEAALRRAETEAANARQDVERYRPLVAENAISKQEFDAALARLATAEADVRSAQAAVEQAKLNLGYATVVAPISGRAGRAQVTEGALASASAGTLLTTIEQLDPIYVNFSQSNAELLQLRREIQAGRVEAPSSLQQIGVTLLLEDGSVYEHQGRVNFLDLAVDPGTGAVSLRAEFPNPDRILLPGMFVRARIAAGTTADSILVPQRAVQLTEDGAIVMTLGPNNVVTPRPVRLGELQGQGWTVREGLRPGDRVIVDRLQTIRPGMQVRPVAAEAGAPQQTAATAVPGGGRSASAARPGTSD